MKIAAYCWIDTDNQERKGKSLKAQFEACRGYCLQKGYDITNQFTEPYSGLTLERPQLNELRE
jgi:DNA invertase Pin-like site-specific DNA recombinase